MDDGKKMSDIESANKLAAIDEDREHRSSGHQGLATLELLMAIYQSSRKRKRVYLSLEEPESPLTLMIEDGWV